MPTSVAWYEFSAGANVVAPAAEGANANDVIAVDIDGDGDLDIVTGNRAEAVDKIQFNSGVATPFNGGVVTTITSASALTSSLAYLLAKFAITSFAFMLELVPEPV